MHFPLVRAVLLILLLSVPAALSAADLGLQVKSMPVGLKANYIDSRGQKFSWIFKGKHRGAYRVQVTGREGYIMYFNAEGFRTKLWLEGNEINYEPYFCNRKLGDCRFRYISQWSEYAGEFVTNLSRTGDSYTFRLTKLRKTEPETGTIYYKFTTYNLIQEYVAGGEWFRLVNIEMP